MSRSRNRNEQWQKPSPVCVYVYFLLHIHTSLGADKSELSAFISCTHSMRLFRASRKAHARTEQKENRCTFIKYWFTDWSALASKALYEFHSFSRAFSRQLFCKTSSDRLLKPAEWASEWTSRHSLKGPALKFEFPSAQQTVTRVAIFARECPIPRKWVQQRVFTARTV
jgi:hypothetical protein